MKEKTLNNKTNPFIKEENKIKYNEDIELLSEKEKEEKEPEEKENEENKKNDFQVNNKLYTIDAKFIETEGKINLDKNFFVIKLLIMQGKNMFFRQKKYLLTLET